MNLAIFTFFFSFFFSHLTFGDWKPPKSLLLQNFLIFKNSHFGDISPVKKFKKEKEKRLRVVARRV